MANYKLDYTGEQVNTAIGKALEGGGSGGTEVVGNPDVTGQSPARLKDIKIGDEYFEVTAGRFVLPSGATSGTLSNDDWNTLLNDPDLLIQLDNELYRLTDWKRETGYFTYTYEGQDREGNFFNKFITIGINYKEWRLMVRKRDLYVHRLLLDDESGAFTTLLTIITDYPEPYTDNISAVSNWIYEHNDFFINGFITEYSTEHIYTVFSVSSINDIESGEKYLVVAFIDSDNNESSDIANNVAEDNVSLLF